MTTTQRIPDPLVTAIEELQKGMAAYDSHPDAGTDDDEAVAEHTYRPSLRTLQQWSVPAVTRAGALAALELANQDLEHSLDSALVTSMIGAAFSFFRGETGTQVDLNATFAAAIARMEKHVRMEALYDALAHLSDSLSGLVSRPRIGAQGSGAEALEVLDDFIMDQMDAVKNRAVAVVPTEWPDQEARIAILMKHLARFRTDADQMTAILPLINEAVGTVDSFD